MPISRIFQAQPLAVHSTVELDESATHHLARVLRIKVNDSVIVFNGEGGEYQGIITHLLKKRITVQLNHFVAREAESPLDLVLMQGISRGDKMDYTIQKAVELGVKKIIPLLTERCTVKLDDEKREKRWQHWRTIIINACEQCGRTSIPELVKPIDFNNGFLQEECAAMECYVLSPVAEAKLKKSHDRLPKQVMLLVGPEGGLTDAEMAIAREAGFKPLNLGPRILRTETAAVAALTVFQCLWGDMSDTR